MKKIMWIIAIIPLIVTAIVLPFIPDRIPMHYNLNGEIDRWGAKTEQLIFPIFILIITLFWHLMTYYFEKKKQTAKSEKEIAELESNRKLLNIVGICQAAMFGIMHFFFLYSAFLAVDSGADHAAVDIGKISCILCGVLFIILGNFMPKSRQNSVIGVRTSWSLYNENTWRKSNHFGAIALMISGVLTIVTAAFTDGTVATLLLLIYLFLCTTVVVIYSKKICQQEKKEENRGAQNL